MKIWQVLFHYLPAVLLLVISASAIGYAIGVFSASNNNNTKTVMSTETSYATTTLPAVTATTTLLNTSIVTSPPVTMTTTRTVTVTLPANITTTTILSTVTSTSNQTITLTTTSLTTTNSSNTFLTNCHITGTGMLQLRIISDSTGTPVQGAKISAVLQATCIVGEIGNVKYSETQKVYINNFTETSGGWLSPVLPPRTTSFGEFNFTVQYSGKTYNFQAVINPVSVTCVTLQVPSGNVTSTKYQFSSGDCASP